MAEPHPLQADVERALADDLLRIHVENYGKGAGAMKVLLSEDLIVVMFDELELQHSEKFLIEEGHGQSVIDLRARFQQAIQSSYRAAVERATGRRVVSFASVTKLDPDYAVEIFRLGPRAAPDDDPVDDGPQAQG